MLNVTVVRSFLDAGEDVIKHAHKIKTPIVYSHGIPDAINDYKATKIAYESTGSTDKTLKAWDDLFHDCKFIFFYHPTLFPGSLTMNYDSAQ